MAHFKYENLCRLITHNIIDPTANLHDHCTLGAFNVIGEDCVVGEKSIIENHCDLKEKTIIGYNSRLENGTRTSGRCKIGDDCILKQNVVVARQVTIGNRVFISPNVVFLYANHAQEWEGAQTLIEDDVFIGAGVVIMPGIVVAEGSVVGAGSLITKSLLTVNGIYFGSPARFMREK